jgi:hypothetical protein
MMVSHLVGKRIVEKPLEIIILVKRSKVKMLES